VGQGNNEDKKRQSKVQSIEAMQTGIVDGEASPEKINEVGPDEGYSRKKIGDNDSSSKAHLTSG